MNLKFTTLTLLLLLSLTVNLWFSFVPVKDNCIPTKVCGHIPPYKIKPKKAKKWIADYKRLLKKEINVVNPDVRYFTLPRCEMAEMLRDLGPDADVRAHLAVEKKKQKNGEFKNSIVLIFEGIRSKELGYVNSDTSFFDFTTPCPRFCVE